MDINIYSSCYKRLLFLINKFLCNVKFDLSCNTAITLAAYLLFPIINEITNTFLFYNDINWVKLIKEKNILIKIERKVSKSDRRDFNYVLWALYHLISMYEFGVYQQIYRWINEGSSCSLVGLAETVRFENQLMVLLNSAEMALPILEALFANLAVNEYGFCRHSTEK